MEARVGDYVILEDFSNQIHAVGKIKEIFVSEKPMAVLDVMYSRSETNTFVLNKFKKVTKEEAESLSKNIYIPYIFGTNFQSTSGIGKQYYYSLKSGYLDIWDYKDTAPYYINNNEKIKRFSIYLHFYIDENTNLLRDIKTLVDRIENENK